MKIMNVYFELKDIHKGARSVCRFYNSIWFSRQTRTVLNNKRTKHNFKINRLNKNDFKTHKKSGKNEW